jgi:DNA-binding NarL/FixJ family response regulator
MLTVSRDDRDLFAALRAGAVGYLLKDMDPRRLPRALESVLEARSRSRASSSAKSWRSSETATRDDGSSFQMGRKPS